LVISVLPVKYQFLSHSFSASTNCHSLLRVRSDQKSIVVTSVIICCYAFPKFYKVRTSCFVRKVGLILDRATCSGTLSETQQTHSWNVPHYFLQVRVGYRYDPVQLSGMLGTCRSECLPGLRCGSMVVLLLGLRFRITSGTGKSASCVCYVLSRRGHGMGLITCPETSYRV
jgi:hypothetical protein